MNRYIRQQNIQSHKGVRDMGSLNAKTGKSDSGGATILESLVWPREMTEEQVLEFCDTCDVKIANTFFQQPKRK